MLTVLFCALVVLLLVTAITTFLVLLLLTIILLLFSAILLFLAIILLLLLIWLFNRSRFWFWCRNWGWWRWSSLTRSWRSCEKVRLSTTEN